MSEQKIVKQFSFILPQDGSRSILQLPYIIVLSERDRLFSTLGLVFHSVSILYAKEGKALVMKFRCDMTVEVQALHPSQNGNIFTKIDSMSYTHFTVSTGNEDLRLF